MNKAKSKTPSKKTTSSVRRDNSQLIILSLLVLVTIVAYLPAFSAGLINWDEKRYLLETPVIQKLNWENIKAIFSTKVLKSYNPLVVTSFAVDYHYAKLSAGWYHTINIILHVFNSLLVFFCCKALVFYPPLAGGGGGQKIYPPPAPSKGGHRYFFPAFVAFLFALHPVHVESVAWIASRKDVMYTFFFLLSWFFYMQQKAFGYYLSIFLFLLSLLSKSQAVTLPVILLLTDYLRNKQWDWKYLTNKIPYLILSIIFGYITIHGSTYVADKYAHALTFGERIIYSVIAFGLYVYKALLPINQTAIYAFTKSNTAEYFIQLIGGLMLIAAATYLVIRYWKINHLLVFGILFFAVNIFLTLHIIAVNSSLIYERFTYVSYIGLFIIAASFIQKLSIKTARPVVIGLVFVFAVLTYSRATVWKDSDSLWSDVIKKNPESYEALNNRGQNYFDKGEMQKALDDYSQSMIIAPNQPYSYNNRSVTYYQLKKYDKSLEDNLKAIGLDSVYWDAVNNRGIIYYGMQRYDSADYWYTKALQMSPNSPVTYFNRGATRMSLGKVDDAINDYNQALKLSPNYAEPRKYLASAFLNKGNASYKEGNVQGALEYYFKATELQPGDAEAYYNIGGIYLMRQDIAHAREYWKKTLQLNPQHQAAKEWLQKVGE